MKTNEQLLTDWFSKPSDSIRISMKRRGIDTLELSRDFGDEKIVQDLFDGSMHINTEHAEILSTKLGGSKEFWIQRQTNYNKALDRAADTVLSCEVEDWLDKVPDPLKIMKIRPSGNSQKEEILRKLVFFNVPTYKSWINRYGFLINGTRFRTSNTFTSSESATLLWLRKGELEADLISTTTWNPELLEDKIQEIIGLSRISSPSRFLPKLKSIFASAGVAFVAIRAPEGCRASGASLQVSPDKAMILVSFRYRADDQFWFTLFHEIGHLILHNADTFVDSDETPKEELESEANKFACDCIIPKSRHEEFRNLKKTRDSILRFSVSLGVSPGLVVGQMQHKKMIQYNKFNTLKRRWKWVDIGLDLK